MVFEKPSGRGYEEIKQVLAEYRKYQPIDIGKRIVTMVFDMLFAILFIMLFTMYSQITS